MKETCRRIQPELIPELNQVTITEGVGSVRIAYNLNPIEEYNSYVTMNREGAEVFGVLTDGRVLVYDCEEGWHALTENLWAEIIWNEHLKGYSADTKLMFIRTIPHLENYTRPVEVVPNTPLLLFEWGEDLCYPHQYMALAHTVLEARFNISKKLGYCPDALKQEPKVHTRPVAFVSEGDA